MLLKSDNNKVFAMNLSNFENLWKGVPYACKGRIFAPGRYFRAFFTLSFLGIQR